MNNSNKQSRWLFTLLTIPLLSGILALSHLGFLFKAGVAGSGILILGWTYSGELKRNRDVVAIFAAFLFSIIGDWFLSNRHGETIRFVMGIAMFFVAHVGYLSCGLMNGKLRWQTTVLILLAGLLFFYFMVFPGISDTVLMIAVLIYLLISCFSLSAAIGIGEKSISKWFYLFGISMVLFSDVVIALREFAKFGSLDFLVLPTYYLAQISVTAALISRKVFEENKVIQYKF